MPYQVLKVEKKEGGIAVLTFNRPDKFNAANAQIFHELAAAVQEMDKDKEVGCMILTGQTFIHPKKGTPFPVFSAGADVEQFAALGKTEAGFDLFIDDFGTGNSSLGYLKVLPAGTVKIDRFFVDESVKSPEDHEYVTSIAVLARSRHKAVILEGIGTPQQYALLKRLKTEGMQGFYFSKPLAAEELEKLLERGVRLPLPREGC